MLSLRFCDKKQLVAWEIFCLSGEANAVKYAIAHEDLQASKTGILGNALHCAARSGSTEAMRVAREIKNINIHALNSDGDSIANLAAENGSVSALELALKEYKISKLGSVHPRKGYRRGRSVFHSAARGGSLDTMEYIINNTWLPRRLLYLDFYKKDVLTYAIESGSLDAIDYAVSMDDHLTDFNGCLCCSWIDFMFSDSQLLQQILLI